MTREEIVLDIVAIIREILGDSSLAIDDMSTPDDIDGWDSVTHVSVVSAIETKYDIKLTLRETMSWETIGELAETVKNKLDA